MVVIIARSIASVLTVLALNGRSFAQDLERADEVFEIFDRAVIHWDETQPDLTDAEGHVIRHRGHAVDRTLELPAAPSSPTQARRIVATVDVEPIVNVVDGVPRPNDRWTRLGNVCVLAPGAGGETVEVEILRFVTGYGASGRFEQDVTALAPLLAGRTTIRAFLMSYSPEPAWRISVRLMYTDRGIGPRRPLLTLPLFWNPHVTARQAKLTRRIVIPPDLDTPRLRITSTGHATDGMAGNEFISCTHVLRVDGHEIARWRPWAEHGGLLRGLNPWAGRRRIGGREIRSSDFDRAGWNPGLVVEPLVIPVPELAPGRHTIELEIIGIRRHDPPDEQGKLHHGYWFVTATIVADERWPEE